MGEASAMGVFFTGQDGFRDASPLRKISRERIIIPFGRKAFLLSFSHVSS